MNLMGKIFTLLIFLMSLAFLVVALMVGASDRNWKAAAARMKARADQATQALQENRSSTLKMEKLLEAEKVSRALQLANLESQLKRAREDYVQKEKQLTDEVQVSQARLAELEAANNRLAQQDSELADLKANNKKLVDDIANQFAEVRNLTNQLFELRNRVDLMQEKESDLVAKLARTQKVLFKNNLDENSNTDHIPPKVEAVVSQVGSNGLFTIHIGEDDGLRPGHEMDISRSTRYVGKGRVVQVKDNLAVLRIIPGLMTDQVREGDSVSTKL